MSLSAWWVSIRDQLESADGYRHPPNLRLSAHIGIFTEPFLTYVLEGSKTIESRFSSHRCPPFRAVEPGDVLLIKAAGGPVVALAEIQRARYLAHPTARDLQEIAQQHGPELRDDVPGFWSSRRDAAFVSLLSLGPVHTLVRPLECPKRDRRGWVVLSSASAQRTLFG